MNIEITSYCAVLENKYQIILQGPPGTGKTFNAKNIAEYLIFDEISLDKKTQKERLEQSEQFKLIQFHPAYSYEDFVRGIVAKSNGTSIEYLTENKTIGIFASMANKNFIDSQKEVTELTKERWIRNSFEDFKEKVLDEIDEKDEYVLNKTVSISEVEEDAFRYSGKEWQNDFRMKYEDIIQLFIHDIKTRPDIGKQNYISGLAKTHASYFKLLLDKFYSFMSDKKFEPIVVERELLKKYVLIIDEINRANLPSVLGELIYALEYRGSSVESMYGIDGDKRLTLPPNLFIIGTMNTADRSVGHIDYAIRRRFAFVDILPDENVIQNETAKTLFNEIKTLFNKDFLSPDFNAKDVMIGHSYFLVRDEDELRIKLAYEIKPILREYLKDGIFLEAANEKIEALNV